MTVSSLLESPIAFVAVTLFTILITKNFTQRNKNEGVAMVSLKVKILNKIMWPFYWLQVGKGFKPLDFDVLKLEAIEEEKVTDADFGDEGYEKAYRAFIDLVNDDRSKWTPVGYMFHRGTVVRFLCRRLRFFHHLKKAETKNYIEKNLGTSPAREPLFIFGLHRTGTTFLHRLLALDPAVRAPLFYELMDVVEHVPGDVEKDTAARIAYYQPKIDLSYKMLPEMEFIHKCAVDDPEECMQASMDKPRSLLNLDLMSDHFKQLWSFEEEFYRNYQKQLQILEHNALMSGNVELARKRWVLKCPAHLSSLNELVQVFPNARLIWTHRDLKQVLPSLSSLSKLGQDMTQQVCDLKKLGKFAVKYAGSALKDGDKSVPGITNPFCNVKYAEVIKNPIDVIKQIYKQFDYEFTPEYERILEEHLAKDKAARAASIKLRGGKKMHNSTLEGYGITSTDLESFSWYNKKYL